MAKGDNLTLTLTPNETAVALRAMIPTKRAVFVWGPPGISKSDTLRQVATSEFMGCIDVRMSQMDPTDLRGIPYPCTVNGVQGVRWSAPLVLPRDLDFDEIADVEADPQTIRFDNPLNARPEITVRAVGRGRVAEIVGRKVLRDETFPDRDGTVHPDSFVVQVTDAATGELVPGKVHWTVTGKVRGILALEEFNSAPGSVQAAAYQLLLDRRLGDYKVPEGIIIVALGNRETDKGIAVKMPTPIMNRLVHVEMRADFNNWQTWALLHRIHPEVVGYLTAFKESLFQFEPGSAARGFPTPRSWHFVSDILTNNPYLNDHLALALVTGAVGDAEGSKFIEFRKIAAELPLAADILSGQLLRMPKKVEVQLAYALTTTLCYELEERANTIKRKHGDQWKKSADRKNWLKEADNFMLFMMENFQSEICVMGARTAISVHRLPFETSLMKNFEVFASKFKNLIVSVQQWIIPLFGLALANSHLWC